MKKLWALPIFGLAVTSTQLIGHRDAIAATLFHAKIDVAQEVCDPLSPEEPCPTTSSATGTFSAELNDAEDALTYKFELNGLDLGASIGQPQTPDTGDDIKKVHIHVGDFGVRGPVVFAPFDLTKDEKDDDLAIDIPTGTVSGIWNADEELLEQLSALKAGNLYVNIHSERFLFNGEIRGQITTRTIPEPTMLLGLALASSAGLLLKKRQRT
jgi:CHRD domain